MDFIVSDAAAQRIAHLLTDEPEGSYLRISVLGGGCSGFQYHFDFDTTAPAATDLVFHNGSAKVVVDDSSIGMLSGSVLDYVATIGSAAFEIKNPNAASSCGCGNSFSVAL